MTEYVLGFVYIGEDKILLQQKNRGGKYLEGKLNGLGGKIEKYDVSPLEAMDREYSEETGDNRLLHWKSFGLLRYNDGDVILHVFYTNVSEDFYDNYEFKSDDPNAEKLFVLSKRNLDWDACVHNLRYLLPLMES